jgi:5-(carboxyamino)imidazole ribonucleotide synthase
LHDPNLKLHLYGKSHAKPGRKMGHITAMAATAGQAAKLVEDAREKMTR